MHRRQFLATSLATLSLTQSGWASAGRPAYLTAAARDRETFLVGLTRDARVAFALPIPSRGHAAAAHPSDPEAVAFARRPGTFALVLDCTTGAEIARLESPAGRHFYGHGAFTADGAYLLTTENDWDAPNGRLGVWDVAAGYARVDELPSGGIGPHEILRLPSGGFAVANGGMQTHPDYDRAVLNLPEMRPNLTWLDAQGQIIAQSEPPEDMRLNSIRHIASDAAGRIVIALQWQGDPRSAVAQAAVAAAPGAPLVYWDHPETARLKHYGGSVAITADGSKVAVTGPKGGEVLFFDGQSGAPLGHTTLPEASGVVAQEGHFTVTTRGGLARWGASGVEAIPVSGDWSWDNHLVPVG